MFAIPLFHLLGDQIIYNERAYRDKHLLTVGLMFWFLPSIFGFIKLPK